MVKCEPLGAEAPFRLRIHSNAQLIMDLHAHLSTMEIIGFLGGRWDPQTKGESVCLFVLLSVRVCVRS